MINNYKLIYKKQHYGLVGKHSAVKVCHWTKSELTGKASCYKNTFYGINSSQCIQMTPALNSCTENCEFCWRFQGFDSMHIGDEDDPEFILEESIKAHLKLISGFKGNPNVSSEAWEKAMHPKHMAISLTGEPTLYTRLGELIAAATKMGISTFLVTNGTLPMVLEKLDPLPTQLYVTVAGPTKEIFNRVLNPAIGNAWENFNKTLELLPSLDTRKVIRHTLVKDVNMPYYDEYEKLDRKADPDFIESKGYVHVGQSIDRLTADNMPSHEMVLEFSNEMARRLGYTPYADRRESRVAMIAKDPSKARIDFDSVLKKAMEKIS
ncbi:4-demethylwyosine synthase TYW1 [Picrophilus oshimae]|uniref:S-adenosyl-L-methionine-dependent tRNA 4-demethylwyosine synthase n=1 Tax=Picrophilus torridus (strain ATCC 700027 / DSM 9790 / JCM 10055 / NBRC 100828 / KAW 2/3) TaxID=1122961 RepID=A0A8G2L7I3_PICTO|nr:4-demethylwyosine synthase TYW1 [Picrophilus oshimae]SMD31152.1 tRNA wybutosine-synthesizing protein 1 [Picrophilus oshimae DSM 9789]